MAIRPWLVGTLALLALGAGIATRGAGANRAPVPSRIFLIVLENHEYEEVAGNPEAPYLNRLAARGALATTYHAVAHPSLPNYLALLGGSTFGISENCTECVIPDPNLVLQLSQAGISWRAYMEGMPHPCFRGGEAVEYVKRHDPFMYFASISKNPGRCADVVPTTRLDADLRRDALPTFGWLSPGLCNDAHNCGIGIADHYLSTLAPRVAKHLGPHGLLVVTFDEGSSEAGGGGQVMTVVVGPDAPRGTQLSGPYDHYSLLAGLQQHFGLPRLRRARQAKAFPLSSWDR